MQCTVILAPLAGRTPLPALITEIPTHQQRASCTCTVELLALALWLARARFVLLTSRRGLGECGRIRAPDGRCSSAIRSSCCVFCAPQMAAARDRVPCRSEIVMLHEPLWICVRSAGPENPTRPAAAALRLPLARARLSACLPVSLVAVGRRLSDHPPHLQYHPPIQAREGGRHRRAR